LHGFCSGAQDQEFHCVTSGGDRCQAKFLTCEISDFTSRTHAQRNILHTKYTNKTDY